MELCDSAGLVDDTKLFTHEEFKKRNANMPSHAQLHDRIFRTMFRGLDINGVESCQSMSGKCTISAWGLIPNMPKPPLKLWIQSETMWSPVKIS